jgi:Ribbon-helix-helix domain
LSRFIDDAVRKDNFERSVAEARAAKAHIPQEELEAIIDEAV